MFLDLSPTGCCGSLPPPEGLERVEALGWICIALEQQLSAFYEFNPVYLEHSELIVFYTYNFGYVITLSFRCSFYILHLYYYDALIILKINGPSLLIMYLTHGTE